MAASEKKTGLMKHFAPRKGHFTGHGPSSLEFEYPGPLLQGSRVGRLHSEHWWVLSGRVSDEWTSDGPFIQVTSLDLKSAYKQLALSPCDYNKTVTIKNPPVQLECFLMNVVPFGASASVLHFLRVSTFLRAVGSRWGSCWACYFDNFPVTSHARASASALASTKGMLRLGFEFGLEKLQPFASHAEGVLIDLSDIGAIHVRNKPFRVWLTAWKRLA